MNWDAAINDAQYGRFEESNEPETSSSDSDDNFNIPESPPPTCIASQSSQRTTGKHELKPAAMKDGNEIDVDSTDDPTEYPQVSSDQCLFPCEV